MTVSTRSYELRFIPLEVGPGAVAHFEAELREGVAFRPQTFALCKGVNARAFRIMRLLIERRSQFVESINPDGLPAALFRHTAVGHLVWETLHRGHRIEVVVKNVSERPETFKATFAGVLAEE